MTRTWVGFVKDSLWRKKSRKQREEQTLTTTPAPMIIDENWAWFADPKWKETTDNTTCTDYYSLSRSRDAIKTALLKNPDILFDVVGEDGVLFVDLIIKEKSLCEVDLIEVSKSVKLDWGRIANKLRLSNDLLEKHAKDIDWKDITVNNAYTKDLEFIKRFSDKMVLDENRNAFINLKLDKAGLEMVFFKWQRLPLRIAIANCPYILVECLGLDNSYVSRLSDDDWTHLIDTLAQNGLASCIADLETLPDPNGIIESNLAKYPVQFIDACIEKQYLPKYSNILKDIEVSAPHKQLATFFEICKPTNEYLESQGLVKLMLQSGVPLSRETVIKYADQIPDWDELMTRYINPFPFDPEILKIIPENVVLNKTRGLPPKYIDKNAYRLDWSIICERQVLPEWLMRKHLDKLDWENVARHQTLTQGFIKDFGYRMNM